MDFRKLLLYQLKIFRMVGILLIQILKYLLQVTQDTEWAINLKTSMERIKEIVQFRANSYRK